MIKEGIDINHREAENIFLKTVGPSSGAAQLAEIIIYSYSSGKETFFYSKDTNEDVKKNTFQGSMSAILKIKEGNKLVDVFFLQAQGNSKHDLIEKIAAQAGRILE